MSEENEENEKTVTFDAEYVKGLRAENASWRQKVRQLEEQTLHTELAVEFARRGLDIDPSMINVPEGMNASEVVDQFSSILQSNEVDEYPVRETPRGITPNKTKPNASSPPAQGAFGGRSLKEVEADPRAREQVRSMYRDLLRSGSHGSPNSIYDS